jgi:hypothetical protein
MFLTLIFWATALILIAYGYFLFTEFGPIKLFAWLLKMCIVLVVVIFMLDKVYLKDNTQTGLYLTTTPATKRQ